MASRTVILQYGGREFRMTVHGDGRVEADGKVFHVRPWGRGEVRVAGNPDTGAWVASTGDTRWVFANGRTFELRILQARRTARKGGHHGSLMAPMPATVRRIDVAVGQTIVKGDTLIVLEAMKMELPVKASADGTIEAINCREGDLVQPGIPLIEIEEAESTPATGT
jgi:biotin carboxyl carrier protein